MDTMTKTPVKKAAKTAKKSPARKSPLADVAKAIAATTPPSPQADAQARYAACVADITAVLKKHRCRIVAALAEPEAVGGEPTNKMLIAATWGIIPES